MLENIGLFRLAADRMRYLTEQQKVVARNIANADTPGYQAQAIGPFSFDQALVRSAGAGQGAGGASPVVMVSDQPGQFTTAANSVQVPDPAAASATYGEKPDGNTVSLEEQMLKQADIGDNFALATSAYAQSVSLMKTAIDAGR